MTLSKAEIAKEKEIYGIIQLGKRCFECGKTHRTTSAVGKCYDIFIRKGQNWKDRFDNGNFKGGSE